MFAQQGTRREYEMDVVRDGRVALSRTQIDSWHLSVRGEGQTFAHHDGSLSPPPSIWEELIEQQFLAPSSSVHRFFQLSSAAAAAVGDSQQFPLIIVYLLS